MSGHYHYECDEYCEGCLPVPANSRRVDYDTGEQDTPANCCNCHRPLDYSLTSDGVKYVIEYILEALRESPESWNTVHPCYDGTYYAGSRHVEIVRDWAEDVRDYFISKWDKWLVDAFLAVTSDPPSLETVEELLEDTPE